MQLRPYVDYERFSIKEKAFIQHYYKAKNPMEKVMKKLGIKKSRFYEMKKRIDECVIKDRRRYKIVHRKTPYPFEDKTEKKEITIEELHKDYVKQYGEEALHKLPNRWKNDLERLKKKTGHSTT